MVPLPSPPLRRERPPARWGAVVVARVIGPSGTSFLEPGAVHGGLASLWLPASK